ncbi:SET domain-containing protein [Blastomyces gilchristii SLH14081]|uniref:SET domain-containing protein n=1 Tax=Blastomyces gilchristii (strain SLH14081) TaxID=559298 RepID=A0A179UY05_BLAGS|nr:SET domain-containing protein [Blastomyces gilchristii SLH14081]OAT12693.1 SET domain-containing protein [Blastomyces gilchristii SLH14081]
MTNNAARDKYVDLSSHDAANSQTTISTRRRHSDSFYGFIFQSPTHSRPTPRIAALKLERSSKSATEVRMEAIKEALVQYGAAIGRIKDAGGWASLAFASSGVYRFCNHRTKLALTRMGGNGERDISLVPLCNVPSYSGRFYFFQFIDESTWDRDIFGDEDPRRVLDIWIRILSGDAICINPITCRSIAADLERGTTIGEYVGYITTGIEGMDVMVADSQERPYQIYQGHMGLSLFLAVSLLTLSLLSTTLTTTGSSLTRNAYVVKLVAATPDRAAD